MESDACAAMCGSKGVQSCRVSQTEACPAKKPLQPNPHPIPPFPLIPLPPFEPPPTWEPAIPSLPPFFINPCLLNPALCFGGFGLQGGGGA